MSVASGSEHSMTQSPCTTSPRSAWTHLRALVSPSHRHRRPFIKPESFLMLIAEALAQLAEYTHCVCKAFLIYLYVAQE